MINDYNPVTLEREHKSHSNATFEEVISTKSLASHLWNVALRNLSNMECGAMEVSDTLLGISLHETDTHIVF